MTRHKHVDFEVPGFAELSDGPRPRASYAEALLGHDPLAWWRLGEATGSVAVDQMGTHDATYVGGVTLGVAGAIARDADPAIALDGATGYAQAPDHPAWDFTAATLLVWFRTGVAGRSQTLLRRDTGATGGSRHWLLRVTDTNQLQVAAIWGSAPGITTSAGVVDDAWHFAAAVFENDGSDTAMRLHLDGEHAGSQIVTGLMPAGNAPVDLGRLSEGGGTEHFAGRLDEAAIFGHALTDADIADLYDRARGVFQLT